MVCTAELREPIIGNMHVADLEPLKILLEGASIVIWVSGGNLYKAERPDFAPVFGFSRSIMLEVPSVKFIVLDIDPTKEELHSVESNIISLLQQASHDSRMDLEYLQHKGVLYVSRLVPDQDMARQFRRKQNEKVLNLRLGEVEVAQLSIKQVGQMDTIHFLASRKEESDLESDFVEVQAKAFGLNAKVRKTLPRQLHSMLTCRRTSMCCLAELIRRMERVQQKLLALSKESAPT